MTLTNAEQSARWRANHPDPTGYNTQKVRELRKLRKENGLCLVCGARKAVLDRTSCRKCINRLKAWHKAKKLTKKAK